MINKIIIKYGKQMSLSISFVYFSFYSSKPNIWLQCVNPDLDPDLEFWPMRIWIQEIDDQNF